MMMNNARGPHVEKKSVAMASGIVLLSVVLGTIAGVVWALLRPTQQVRVLPNDQLAVIQAPDAVDPSFIGVLWYVAVTAICGMVLGIATFRNRVIVGPAQMLTALGWSGFSALMSAAVTYIVGQSVATLLQPDLVGLKTGETLRVIPDFSTYVALLAAPLLAMIALWARVLFQADFADDTAAPESDVPDVNSDVNNSVDSIGATTGSSADSSTV